MGEPSKKNPLRDHPTVQRVMQSMRVTKVVATRSVKGRNGDHFLGFAATFDSIQDDVTTGGDLVSTLTDDETCKANNAGLTLKEARVASILLHMQADRSAHQHALAAGNISPEQCDAALRTINSNYTKLLSDLLDPAEPSAVANSPTATPETQS